MVEQAEQQQHGSGRRPDLDSVYSINPDGSRNAIHPAEVSGRFQRYKALVWTVLIGVYVALPWIEIGGHPAVLIDIPRRHFYLFGNTFTTGDFWLAFFFVTGIAFGLYVLSALWGRVWCGYGCPQTVFLEGVYRRIEQWIEGSPRRRRELDRAPWTGAKIVRRGGKYAVFLLISAALAHTFLGYFMPIREVVHAVTSPPSEHWVAFLFVAGFTAIIFVNYTWFREQLCIVVCPYGRLQGVLYDQHTINVGYDFTRGEPRGKRQSATGDCIDCFRCVQVCPTGIDIRNGTQMECVGCANCIDACDEVMARIGKPAGLIRYDSLAGFEGRPRRLWRLRVGLYLALLLVGVGVFAAAASSRTSFGVQLLRLPGELYTLDDGVVTNRFSLHLENKAPVAETFRIESAPREGMTAVIPTPALDLPSLADQRVPVFVRVERARFEPGMSLSLTIRTSVGERTVEAPLLGPLGRTP